MKFFLDNNLSPRLVGALGALDPDHQVVHLRQKFLANTADVVWIPSLAEEDEEWVIVSGDEKITRSRAERAVWQESGLTAFFFGGNYPGKKLWIQVIIFLTWWPEITREAREHREGQSGSGYIIPVTGKKWKIINH